MRIYLRAFELEDYKLINKWRNDDEITHLTGGHKRFVSSERERKWVEEKIYDENNLYMAICLRESDDMIGYASINHIDWRNRQAEWAGIIIGRKDLWNKNVAIEVGTMIIRFAFEELGLNRLYAYWMEQHTVSEKIAKRHGFKREGLLRQSLFKNNCFNNVVVGSILRDEYEEMIKNKNIEVKA